MGRIGITHTTNYETVQRWHLLFRDGGNKFPHPNPTVASGKTRNPDPPFFIEFPEAKHAFVTKADELLYKNELSGKAMADYVNNKLVPSLLKEHNENMTNKISRYDFLRGLRFLKPINKSIS